MASSKTTDWTGLAARTWDELGGDEAGEDYEFLKNLLRQRGGASLDVGCGTGRLLLRLLADGLDVHGIDTSADMLGICQQKAQARGLTPRLLQQSMLHLDSARAYNTIFIACGSFMLLCDDAAALAALKSLEAALAPGGLLMLHFFGPNSPPSPTLGVWENRRTEELKDGRRITMEIINEDHDTDVQVITSRRRYTIWDGTEILEQELMEDAYRWYHPQTVRDLLSAGDFEVIDEFGDWDSSPLGPDSPLAIFLAQPRR